MKWYDQTSDQWISIWKALVKGLRLTYKSILAKLYLPWRKIKVDQYRRKRLLENGEERLYLIQFNINLDDAVIGPFEIEVPAQRMYLAKKQLQKFVETKVEVDIIKFENLTDGDTKIENRD